jgi:tetratricopeptide (TPR) repeat protein
MTCHEEIQRAYESILDQHFDQAAEWFLRAIEKDPLNADLHYKLSITFARSNKLDVAFVHARFAQSLKPHKQSYEDQVRILQAMFFFRDAEHLIQQGHHEIPNAITLLQEAIKLDPLSEKSYLLLANANAEIHNYDKAVETLQELLELNPKHEFALALIKKYIIHKTRIWEDQSL